MKGMKRRDGGELLPAILRIDVDKPFLVKKSFTKRTCLFYSLGYLESCKAVVKDLDEQGIKASLFFQQRGCTPSNPASTTLLEKALTGNASLTQFPRQNSRLIKARGQNKDFAQELLKRGQAFDPMRFTQMILKDFLENTRSN